jgi:hypothetical protein
MFPVLKKKMDIERIQQQHVPIHAGLEEIFTHIRTARVDTSKFDAQKLREQMLSLREPLVSPFRSSTYFIPFTCP